MIRLTSVRVLPVLLLLVAAGVWFGDVQEGGQYLVRNLLPLGAVLVLSLLTVWRGEGRWTDGRTLCVSALCLLGESQ
jgi:hypothetical protein